MEDFEDLGPVGRAWGSRVTLAVTREGMADCVEGSAWLEGRKGEVGEIGAGEVDDE